jgi:hypothetical protein
MKLHKFSLGFALASVMTVLMFTVALANEYTVPVIIDGEMYSVTVAAEGGRVISATSDISGVEIGEIKLNVAPGSEIITETNLADMIISNDFPSFSAGEPGEVSVVHTAIKTDSIGAGHLYVVVRNNTDNVIYNVQAEADLYSSNDDYLGTESNLYRFQPSIVPPGGISASFVYFSGIELSKDDTYADSPGVEQASEAVVTTSEELEAYHIVRAILREVIDVKRITLRDVQTYCGILLDDTNRKPICRLHFNRTQKYMGFFAGQSDNAKESQKEQRVPIADIDEIYTFAERLKATVIHYEDGEHKRSKQTA